MARPLASIDAEITAIEADIASMIQSAGSDTTSVSKVGYEAKTKRLDRLYQQRSRLDGTSPMIARGVLRGLSVP